MLFSCLCKVIFKQTKEDSTHPQTFYIITQSFFHPFLHLWIFPGNAFNHTHSITHILPSMTEAFPDTHTAESQVCRVYSVCSVWGCFFTLWIITFPYAEVTYVHIRLHLESRPQCNVRTATFPKCGKYSLAQTSSFRHAAGFCKRAPSVYPCLIAEYRWKSSLSIKSNPYSPPYRKHSSACVFAFTYCCCIWHQSQKQLLISQCKLHDCSMPQHWATSASGFPCVKGFSSSMQWSSWACGWSEMVWMSQSPSSM